MLVNYPPIVAVSSLVSTLRCVAIRLLRKGADIRKRYWKGVLWSPSYLA